MKSPSKFVTRNLFNELQEKFNTNAKLEFASNLPSGVNAQYNSKTNTITINSKLENQYAPLLAHEYLGHAIMDNISSNTRQSIFDGVIQTNWYRSNSQKLVNAIQKDPSYTKLNATNKKTTWQTEVINKYLENVFTSNNNYLSSKMISDIFLKNNLLNRLMSNFNKNNNLNMLKNDSVLNEIYNSINTLFKKTNKNVQKALDKFVKGEQLTNKEEKYYKDYKELFDTLKEFRKEVSVENSKAISTTLKTTKNSREKLLEKISKDVEETTHRPLLKYMTEIDSDNNQYKVQYISNNMFAVKLTNQDTLSDNLFKTDVDEYQSRLIKTIDNLLNESYPYQFENIRTDEFLNEIKKYDLINNDINNENILVKYGENEEDIIRMSKERLIQSLSLLNIGHNNFNLRIKNSRPAFKIDNTEPMIKSEAVIVPLPIDQNNSLPEVLIDLTHYDTNNRKIDIRSSLYDFNNESIKEKIPDILEKLKIAQNQDVLERDDKRLKIVKQLLKKNTLENSKKVILDSEGNQYVRNPFMGFKYKDNAKLLGVETVEDNQLANTVNNSLNGIKSANNYAEYSLKDLLKKINDNQYLIELNNGIKVVKLNINDKVGVFNAKSLEKVINLLKYSSNEKAKIYLSGNNHFMVIEIGNNEAVLAGFGTIDEKGRMSQFEDHSNKPAIDLSSQNQETTNTQTITSTDNEQTNVENNTSNKVEKSLASLNKYNEEEISHLNNNYNSILNNVEEIKDYISKAIKGDKSISSYGLVGKISEELSKRILKDTGVNVDDYSIALNADNLKHINDRHIENQANQIPLTQEEILDSFDIIQNYDKVEYVKENGGENILIFYKKIDGTYKLVSLISGKNKRLSIKTLYKIEKGRGLPPVREDDTSSLTTRPKRDGTQTPSNDNLPNNSKNVNNENVISATVAPYYKQDVTKENYNEIKNKIEKAFSDKANKISSLLGIKIEKSTNNLGGFVYQEGKLAGQMIQEISYTYDFKNASTQDVDMFACLLGDLGYEQQESVISANYIKDSSKANAYRFDIHLKNIDNIGEVLSKAGIVDFTLDLDTKTLQLLWFDLKNTDKFEKQVKSLVELLGDNYEGRTKDYVQSRYLDSKARLNFYGSWLHGQDQTRNSNRELRLYTQTALEKVKVRVDENIKSLADDLNEKTGKTSLVENDESNKFFELADFVYAKTQYYSSKIQEIFKKVSFDNNISWNLSDPQKLQKSRESIADRLYRNIKEGKGTNPYTLKDWARTTFIFDSNNIKNVKNVINDLKPYIKKVDIKNSDGYKGIHLNLNYESIPIELQLHTKESWKLKLQSDAFYEKYRSIDVKKLQGQAKLEFKKSESYYNKLWNQILEDRDFQALRAEVSSLKNSTSSSLGSISQPNNDLGSTHLPSISSNESTTESSYLINRPVDDNTNFDTSSSSSKSSITQEDLLPYETNKALEIKEGAKEKEGKYISLKSTTDIYKNLEQSISNLLGSDFTIENRNQKARRLFEEYNILKNSAKKEAVSKFVKDILQQDVISSSYLGEGNSITYEEYLTSQGASLDSLLQEGTDTLYDLLNEKAISSKTTNKIERLHNYIDKLLVAKKEFRASMKFIKNLHSIQKNLQSKVSKYGNTGQLDINSGIKGLFNSYFSKFRFTKGEFLSISNLNNLNELVNNGSFNSLIDSIINPNQEVNNLSELTSQADFIKDIAKDLSSSLKLGQKHLNYQQVSEFINLNKAIYKLYKDFNSGSLELAREQSNELILKAKNVASRAKNINLLNYIKSATFDFLSPKEIFGYMLGGTDSKEFDLVYNKLYKGSYERQVGKYVDFLKLRDEHISTIRKYQFKKIKVGNLKVNKYVLYNFYLNSLSPDNTIRMKNSNLNFKTKSDTNINISYEALQKATDKYLTEAEKADLNDIFKLYNTELKDYVEKTSIKILGFKVSRENYYPILTSEIYKNVDFSNPNSIRFNINAMNNGRLKKLSNTKSKIEINVNPLNLFNNYVESMTITGEIGLASQKLNRLFQLKNEDGDSLMSVVSEYLPSSKTYIASMFNKLIGNVNTIERVRFLDKLIGRWFTVTLGINPRSVLKQFGSYFTVWEKVGVSNGLKTMLRVPSISKINTIARYLKENNAVFKLRVYEHGYVRGATLSAGVDAFANDKFRKLLSFTLRGMEAMDRLTCYLSFMQAETYVQATYGYKIGSEENMAEANKMFTEIILHTQSNSDRISMSRIRAGEKGWVVKNLFGLFQSDTQNKAGLLFNIVNDSLANKADTKSLEEKLKNATTDKAKQAIQEDIDKLKAKKKKIGIRARGFVSGLIMSSLVVTLADMLADWLYDKKDPEDEQMPDLLIKLVSNATIDWIPYFNQIYNWFEYDGVELSAFSQINNFIQISKGLLDGNNSSIEYLNAVLQLGQVFGLPINNLNKLIQGIIGNFDPEYALKYKSLLYGLSQTYLSSETNKYIESGNIKKAKANLNFNFSTYKFELSDELSSELIEFKKQGIKVNIKNSITSYKNEEGKEVQLTQEELTTFNEIYNQTSSYFNLLKQDSNYEKLAMEEKAKTVKKLADIMFDIAKYKALNILPTSKIAKYYALSESTSTLVRNLAIINYLTSKLEESENKKKDLIKYINKIPNLTKVEKLLICNLMGYNISSDNTTLLSNYMLKSGLSRNEISNFI